MSKLKITNEDFQTLSKYIVNVPKRDKLETESWMRFNWDMFHAAKIEFSFMNHLYSYLNDDHINSALAVILGNSGQNNKGKTK